MKISQKLTLGFISVSLLVGIVGFWGLRVGEHVLRAFEGIEQHFRSILAAATTAANDVKDAECHLMLFLALHQEADRGQVLKSAASLKEQVTILDKKVKIPEGRLIVSSLEARVQELLPVHEALLEADKRDRSKTGSFDFHKHRDLVRKLDLASSAVRDKGVALSRLETHFLSRHTVVTAAAEAMSYAKRTEGHLLLFLALGEPLDRAKFFKRRSSLDEQVATLDEWAKSPGERELVDTIKSKAAELFSTGLALLAAYDEKPTRSGSLDFGKHEALLRRLNAATHGISDSALRLAELNITVEQSLKEAAMESAGSLQNLALGILLTALFMSLVLGYGIARTISNPLEKLRDAAVEIGKGKLDTNPGIASRDEVGQLADSFNKMAAELNRSRAQLLAANEELERRVEERTVRLKMLNEQLVIDIDRRERAEEALRRSEEYFRSLTDNATDMITILNRDATVRYCSASVRRTLGYEPEEMIGRSVFDLMHPEDVQDVQAALAGLIADPGAVRSAEFRFLHRDGSWRIVESVANNLLAEGLAGVVVNSRDITDRKQAEEALRGTMQTFRTLTALAPVGIFQAGASGDFLYVNERWCALSGLRPEEAGGSGWSQALHPGDRERVSSEWTAATQEGREFTSEYRFRTPEGKVSWLWAKAVPLRDAAGAVTGYIGTITDVTESREAQEAVRESEEKYRIVANNTYDWEFWIGPEEQILYMSPSCKRISGYDIDQFRADPGLLDRIVHPDDRAIIESHRRIVQERLPCQEIVFRIIRPDGTHRWIGHVCQPVFGGDGAFLGSRGSNRDITERIVAQEALRESEAKYRALMDDAGDAILLADTQGNLLEANAKTEELLGYTKEELRKMHVSQIVPERCLDRVVASFKQVEAEGSGSFIEREILTKGGEVVTVDITGRLIEYAGARVVQGILRDVTERKLMEEGLRKAAREWQSTFDSVKDIVMLLDSEFRIVRVNAAAGSFFGLPVESIIGNHCYSLMHGICQPYVNCAVSNMMETKRHEETEFYDEERDSWFLVSADPVFDDNGDIVHVVQTIKNVTERKKAEEALRVSEARLIEAQRIAHLGNWDWDIVNNRLFWSDEIFRIFGLSPQGFGATYDAFLNSVHPEDRELVQRSVDASLENNLPYSIDHRIILPDGTERVVHEQGEVTRDEKGLPIRMIGTVIDITARSRAQQALRESEHRFRMLVQYLPQKIFLKDKNSVYLYCNEDFASGFGLEANDVIGKTDFDLYSRSMAEKYVAEDKGVMASRRRLDEEERYQKEGREYVIRVFKSPVENDEGDVTGVLGILWDVTEKVRLESIAEAVNTMDNIGYVFSGIRHEIGNPINSVKITLSVLKNKIDLYPKETIAEYLERALSELGRVEYLLRALKSFNMYEIPEIQDLDMNAFVDKFIALISGDCAKRGIMIRRAIEKEADWGRADPRALQQVLLNVTSNAMDALEGGKEPLLGITVSKVDDSVRIRIIDNGCGMTEDQQMELFKPFRTTKPRGTGLGLVIAKKMLAKMSSSIAMISHPGEGTIVDITIPQARDDHS